VVAKHLVMFKTFVKISFRNLWRYKIFSFINVLGLAIGMASCFLIFLYVRFEFSYDSFHRNADRTYRLVADVTNSTGTHPGYQTSAPMARSIKTSFPEVQSITRVIPASVLVVKDDIKFQEENTLWADSSFFSIFDFSLKYGDPQTALIEPNSIVFSETTARKYFGNANPIGKSILLTGLKLHAKVTGVMKDIPENSHIKADMLISMVTYTHTFQPAIEQDWNSFIFYSYLLLEKGANPKKLEAGFPALLAHDASGDMDKTNLRYSMFLEPLRDIYLRSSRGAPKTGNLHNLYVFSLIAIFLLLIACVNFINLTTARSMERAKEVGIRKVSGAVKTQLMGQFLIESMCISLVAFVIALFLISFSFPVFNQVVGKTIATGVFVQSHSILYLFILSVGVGLLAGIYPAWVLSAFNPISVLKGRFVSSSWGVLLRKILVLIQFTISITLMVGVIVVYAQVHFMRSQPLGFNKDQLMVLDNIGDQNIPRLKQLLAEIPGVFAMSASSSIPGKDYNNSITDQTSIENSSGEIQQDNIATYNVDCDFLKTYQIGIAAGRDFSKDFQTDSLHALILNMTAVRKLGYNSGSQVIGKQFKQERTTGTIIGVIDDFHFHSLKEAVQPLALRTGLDYWQFMTLKLNGRNLPSTIKEIKEKWELTNTIRPFNNFFLDQAFDQKYRSEVRFGRLFLFFVILAIFISGLGLLALASYSTLQRNKEIGIRKVLGASVVRIVALLASDFIKLVIISFVIATPLAWYFMNAWLDDFPYRIQIAWWMFASAGLSAFIIALTTVSFQAIKTALMNPVKSLRTD
jgi:putative ABC transport system permease protein